MSRRTLIVGNWKLHGSLAESLKLVTAIKHQTAELTHLDMVLTPPFTALYSVSVALSDTHIALGAQNLFHEDEGAYTGEVSGVFLKELGCDYVIVGHSERRQYFHETDLGVGLKVQAALRNDLTPVVCIGESLAQREKGEALEVIAKQLKGIFQNFTLHDLESGEVAVAYEPIWAIGTGKNAEPEQIAEIHHAIRSWLTRYFDAPAADRIRILYGGSVKPENAAALLQVKHVDGLLVGGASLNAAAFVKILKSA